jgi:hypothetical protein
MFLAVTVSIEPKVMIRALNRVANDPAVREVCPEVGAT